MPSEALWAGRTSKALVGPPTHTGRVLTHEKVAVHAGARSGLPIVVAVHSTAFGPAAGGVRMTTYPDWRDGLEDALRLSEAMTLKCAIAGLPHGGGKTVIALPPGHVLDEQGRRDVMLDLGDVVQSFGGSYVCGEDVGTTAEDMLVARERTPWAVCLPESEGGSGEPSEPTAIGVHAAIGAVLEHLYGEATAAGRRVTIIGLGQVGGRLARLLAADGAALSVTDADLTKKALADELGATWVDVNDALTLPADLVVPAALGGLLVDEVVDRLECRAICGPANNQLATPEVAARLHARGILWAPDFVVNAGGVLYAALVEFAGAAKDEALARVRGIGATTGELLALAEAEGTAPLVAAERLAHARLAAR
jgi:leucine dehydrogenase